MLLLINASASSELLSGSEHEIDKLVRILVKSLAFNFAQIPLE